MDRSSCVTLSEAKGPKLFNSANFSAGPRLRPLRFAQGDNEINQGDKEINPA
jgi:hypothetical protein